MRRSAPASLLPLTTTKAAAIYPELNKDTEPKPLPPVPVVEEPLPIVPMVAASAPTPTAGGGPPSVVTCGNVQISMPQSPQTIQINQWNQEKHIMPNSALVADQQMSRQQPSVAQHTIPQPAVSQHSIPQPGVSPHALPQPSVSQHSLPQPNVPQHSLPQPSLTQPVPPKPSVSQPNLPQSTTPQNQLAGTMSSYTTPSQQTVDVRAQPLVKPSRSDGSLKITDIYEGAPASSSASQFGQPPTPPSTVHPDVPSAMLTNAPQNKSYPDMVCEIFCSLIS